MLAALRDRMDNWPALAALLFQNPRAVERLVRQFDPAFIHEALRLVDPEVASLLIAFVVQVEALAVALSAVPGDERVDVLIWRDVFAALNRREALEARLRRVVEGVIMRLGERLGRTTVELAAALRQADGGGTLTPYLAPERIASGDGSAVEETGLPEVAPTPAAESWDVANAGLVVLHPFIPRYLEALGLVLSGAFVSAEARRHAVAALEFLVSEEEEAPEYALLLNKLLCGVPVNEPVDRKIERLEATRDEAGRVLQAALGHWKALGQTTPEGLREGFLRRDGRLRRQRGGWKLDVQKKTHDILLGRLPWGMSMITFPWMPDILHVEWG